MAVDSNLTPLMKQYWEIKTPHPDKILLFRMGDFFEMFHEDALRAAPILGIALTKRNQKAQDETPMCGVPHHSIAGPIQKLLDAGFKVAICDQIEDPQEAKGLVKRAITRILSPGMVFDPEALAADQPNYLVAMDSEHVAFLDASTRESFYYRTKGDEQERLVRMLNPVEVVGRSQDRERFAQLFPNAHISVFEEILPTEEPEAVGRLKAYHRHMVGGEDSIPLHFEMRELQKNLELGPTTLAHLEVFETARRQPTGSLFWALDRTSTPGGKRRLRHRLAFPSANQKIIEERLDRIEGWMKQPDRLRHLRQALSRLGDLERRLGKLSLPNFNPRDLRMLTSSLEVVSGLSGDLGLNASERVRLAERVTQLNQALVDDPPVATKDGGVFRKGYQSDLDEWIDLSTQAHEQLSSLEAREKERTGIPSLKIKYNSVFGYFAEVTHTHQEKVPSHYRRKQTLAQAERYIFEELENLETKILSARGRRIEMETQLFRDLVRRSLDEISFFLEIAHRVSEMDVDISLAWLSLEAGLVRPRFHERGIEIRGSRHPVVEQMLRGQFVPNDIGLAQGECLLLTGPNMAGKSTLMRQVATCCLMAQAGSFVPATEAALPLLERIQTRIGANDHLSEGLSTFMVEMKETAELLRRADSKSLLILDEIGRGTSTFDGMSLAQAILEHLATKVGAYTLFATHYHELTGIANKYPNVRNAHMAIHERAGQLSFLHTLRSGPANRSYGIHVARLAGLPTEVLGRAEQVLREYEIQRAGGQLSLFVQPSSNETKLLFEEVLEEIRQFPLEKSTPLEALNRLSTWRSQLQSEALP